MRLRLARRSLPFVVFGLTVAACAASGGGSSPPGSASSVGGSPSSLGGTSIGGNSGSLSNPGSDDGSLSGDACQHLDVQFVPRIPLVYVLVDSSGSMFQPSSDGGADNWSSLRTAALSVLQSLQSQVDFGFGDYGSNGSVSTYTAADYAAHMCGILNTVPIAPDNYSAISTEYTALGDMQPFMKTNTPAEIALGQAAGFLSQAASERTDGGAQAGGQYILLVTDGETDFCDDGDPICPADAVTAEVQALYAQGIQTLVLGLPSDESTISPQALQAFANAGVGVTPTAPPVNPGQPPASGADVYQQCFSGELGWQNLYKAAGLTGQVSLATYAAAGASVTNATLYSPASTSVADLATQLAAALQTVKSCSFDLQGAIQVDLADAGEGSVAIDGASIPYVGDAGTDGWMMASTTELELVGSACGTWRTTGTNIAFNFPCNVLSEIAR